MTEPVILALMAAIGAGLAKVYADVRHDRDFWRDAFLESLGKTDNAITVAKKAARG